MNPQTRPGAVLTPIALTAGCAATMLLLAGLGVGNPALLHALAVLALLAIVGLALSARRRGAGEVAPVAAASEADLASGTGAAAVTRAEAAETANLAKSRYLANVSHEIRSPLNAIYGYAQLVERNEGGVDPQEAARVIRRCAEHLTTLVEGLLDVSQVEHGVLRVRTEDVRFPAFLEQIVSMMRPAAAAKGVEFEFLPPARLPEIVRLDQSRFRQVLLNLLSNAIKFTDHGKVTFAVRYAGQIATFEVRDTGPGIHPDELSRIFEPFDRGEDAGKLARPGAGLGLSISRAIVGILGGNLEVESTLGEGTCFRVTMMVGEVAGKIDRRVQPRRTIGYEGPRRSVLIVDDEADQRLLLERLLSGLGFAVTTCGDGESAAALAGTQAFDLAILDITMPGISGWEVAARLRAAHGRAIRILMLSANTQEFHKPEHATPSHDHFLTKPVELNTLTEVVGGLLGLVWRMEPLPGVAEPRRQPPAMAPAPAATVPLPAARPGTAPLDDEATRHVERLRELLRIGYVRGIEAEIRALAEHGEGAQELAARLFDRLDRFDLAGMKRELEGA
nr:hybrid sensor histidine kinase/response regulator [Novosphingobium piscinae]